MSLRKCVAQIMWLVEVVSAGNARFTLGYCCRGQGVFIVIPAGKCAGWFYGLLPFIVDELYEVDGRCEFAESCLRFSCPFNKATYESIIKSYKHLGVETTEEVKKLVERVEKMFEKLVEIDPELKSKLCEGYHLFYEQAPIRIRKR